MRRKRGRAVSRVTVVVEVITARHRSRVRRRNKRFGIVRVIGPRGDRPIIVIRQEVPQVTFATQRVVVVGDREVSRAGCLVVRGVGHELVEACKEYSVVVGTSLPHRPQSY